MLSKLAIRRLTKLADFMDSLPKEANKHFDMGAWLWKKEGPYPDEIGPKDPWKCGATACALGWAATVPDFRKRGLRVAPYRGCGNLAAASDFFDIEQYQCDKLFSGRILADTPKQWAKRCRKFIKENS